MNRIVLLPLDERPCNIDYPEQLARLGGLPLSVPPLSLLGDKKRPADCDQLAEWLKQEAEQADSLIVSIDMLVYGGIVPSRLHHYSPEHCQARIDLLKELKLRRPELKIYAFNLIMRTPANSSNDEEPDYYADYGSSIFRYSWLKDKQEREELDAEERNEWNRLLKEIPEEVLTEHLRRRSVNSFINEYAIRLAQDNIIDFLIIPLDDNAQYGFSAMEQRKLLFLTEELNIMDRVYLYPGADEIGCTLVARVFCETMQYRPEIFVRYSSTQGPFVIPRYEDRSLNESIKSHITAGGACIADSSHEAEWVLMVHSPPVGQQQAAESSTAFADRHRSYFSELHFNEFIQAMRNYISKGKTVALADVANSNGSDHTFMKLVAKSGLLPELAGYSAWNTSGNTLGTVIAHGIIESYFRRPGQPLDSERLHRSREFYLLRLVEDWGYQAIVRSDVTKNILPGIGANYFDVAHVYEQVTATVREKLTEFIQTYLQDLEPDRIHLEQVEMPWKRMFEVGLKVKLDAKLD
ncbi:DUF4127 family protein [Paenibacillus sp. J2TS4]|uniref:DUF4127 family protein n=1 Tax=Paenibacillus sp. J2TS4 TaxID=2807194 RepID=UPI001B18D32F|nr:DUF4127 family protein [Paenibacillus sp. J2TS4]GIP35044.1 hypothetical protein J2TS4_42540 [Paenibacillus sp. J2TS4]